jgi:branched-chain amino acid transport system permease protein
MVLFVASIVGGGVLGGIFALIGLGFVLAFRATGTFNFAHGELMLLPAFIVGYAELHHLAFTAGLVIAVVIAAVIGAAFYLLVLRHTTGLHLFMGAVATFGLAAILDGVMGIVFGSNQYVIQHAGLPSGNTHILKATVSKEQIVLTVFSLLLAALVMVVVRFTHLGVMIRAAGQDAILASQGGIPVRRIYLVSWGASAVLAGIAGIVYGASAVVNTSMVTLGLAAIPAIVLGGMDSIGGAIVGGIIVGLIESFTQVYLGGTYVDAVTYGMLLIVLLAYPQGLFGTKQVVRA